MAAEDGQVLCWGSGQHGQHGHGCGMQLIPLNVGSVFLESMLPNVGYKLASGSSHTVCSSRG